MLSDTSPDDKGDVLLVPMSAGEMDGEAENPVEESVHLATWPTANDALRDTMVEDDVRLAMRLSSLGRAVRGRAQIKVRQPLQEMLVMLPGRAERESLSRIEDQLMEELNVKAVRAVDDEPVFSQPASAPTSRTSDVASAATCRN